VDDDPEDEDVPDAVVLLPARIVPIPRIVVDPRVTVLMEEPLDIVERIGEVVIGDEDALVMVEAYEI
jgi:hypothetical protein